MSKKQLFLYVVTHPDMEKGFILASELKANKMIEKNPHIWEKFSLDAEKFKIERYSVKDNTLYDTIRDGMPELFL